MANYNAGANAYPGGKDPYGYGSKYDTGTNTMSSAGKGAMMGSKAGPAGAIIGGALGGIYGFLSTPDTPSIAEQRAAWENGGGGQGDALDAAMRRLQEFSAQQYAQRQKDLQATMAFYGPAENYLKSIYGQPTDGQIAPGAPKQGIPGVGGQLRTPPGFPRQSGDPTLGYGQGPRRGF